MFRIKNFRQLTTTIASLVIVFITVIAVSDGSNMSFVGGSAFGVNYVKPSIEWLTQWSVVIVTIIIVGLIIYAIINYFMNRNKPEKPSEEVQAIRDLTEEIRRDREQRDNKDKP